MKFRSHVSKIAALAFTLASAGSLHAQSLPCNATGLVSQNTQIYNFTGGNFTSSGYTWNANHYARIVKTVTGSILDIKGKVIANNVQFDLVLESDNSSCSREYDWVRDADFVRLP
jgi:hypothetical protein